MAQLTVKASWSTIDQSADPEYFVRFMDTFGRQDESPGQYNENFDRLKVTAGSHVLDVGCGTGGPMRVMAMRVGATGRVIGMDNSATMLDEARRRDEELRLPVEYVLGDVHHMPFAENSFDACYSLGVFEIVGDPLSVLAEMVRVTRPGGHVLVSGPDADTWTVDATDRAVTRTILHHACDLEWNGWIGRQLPAAFKALGLQEINVSPTVGMTSNYPMINDLWLADHVAYIRENGVVSAADLEGWLADLEQRYREGRFFSSLTSFTVTGRKP